MFIMVVVDRFFDEVDAARVQRAKELSEVKHILGGLSVEDPCGVASKAVVVLAYASWEGFYNDCVKVYIDFLRSKNVKIRDTEWVMLVGALHAEFESVKARNHSLDSRVDFVEKLHDALEFCFDRFDHTIVEARSNLNFSRIVQSYGLLRFDVNVLQPYRNKIDRELVGWRHAVAHGDSPDLQQLNIEKHIDFVQNLLLMVSGQFQDAMVRRV